MRVTIGLPFYNNEATLSDAVRSVFAQSHQDWELILIDDGSSDGSLEIARAVKDERVRVMSDGENRKLATRLNQIVAETKHDFLARMDADDMMLPNRLEEQLETLSDPQVQIVSSAAAMISKDNQLVGTRGGILHELNLANLLRRGPQFIHGSVTARTEWFRRNQYDNTMFRSEDAELWCRACARGELGTKNVRVLNRHLYACREEAGVSISKLRGSYQVKRMLLRKYGNEVFSQVEMLQLLSKARIRMGVFRVCNVLGALGPVTTKIRNQPIRDSELQRHLEQEIAEVLATKVPGLD